MRKFLFNPHLLGTLFGAVGLVTATRRGPRDSVLVLRWLSWATTLALSVGEIRAAARGVDLDHR